MTTKTRTVTVSVAKSHIGADQYCIHASVTADRYGIHLTTDSYGIYNASQLGPGLWPGPDPAEAAVEIVIAECLGDALYRTAVATAVLCSLRKATEESQNTLR